MTKTEAAMVGAAVAVAIGVGAAVKIGLTPSVPQVRMCTRQPTDGGVCFIAGSSIRLNDYVSIPLDRGGVTGQCAATFPCPPEP